MSQHDGVILVNYLLLNVGDFSRKVGIRNDGRWDGLIAWQLEIWCQGQMSRSPNNQLNLSRSSSELRHCAYRQYIHHYNYPMCISKKSRSSKWQGHSSLKVNRLIAFETKSGN